VQRPDPRAGAARPAGATTTTPTASRARGAGARLQAPHRRRRCPGRPGAAAAAAPAARRRGASPWQIGARFGADTFRNGMDPLAILSYVAGLGTVHQVRVRHRAVPTLDDWTPRPATSASSFGWTPTPRGGRSRPPSPSFSFVQRRLRTLQDYVR
jgi:hypothetical protein